MIFIYRHVEVSEVIFIFQGHRIVAMKDKQSCLRYGIHLTRLTTTDGERT
jgi:hypothetical protein